MSGLIRLVVPVLCLLILAYSMSFEKNPVQSNVNKQNESTLPVLSETPAEGDPQLGRPVVVRYPDVKDEFSTYKEENPKMAGILRSLKEESPGVAGWLVGFADAEKVIFYNHAYMLTYNVAERRFLGAIDLLNINAGHIQGSEITAFSFSPQGDYVVINNGFGERNLNWTSPMYLADVRTGEVQKLGEANHFRITDSWSASSRFYAFADIEGGYVTIYDRVTGTKNTVESDLGRIKRILVSDYGDVLLDAQTLYRLSKSKGYSLEKLGISGDALEINGHDLVYFSEGVIEKVNLISGSPELLQQMPADVQVRQVKGDQAIFSVKDKTVSVVYNLKSGNLYQYHYTYDSYPSIQGWSFSPDSRNCMVHGGEDYLLINEQGQHERIRSDNSMSAINGGWINNHTFVAVFLRDNHNFKAGNFHICAYDLSSKQRLILYEQ